MRIDGWLKWLGGSQTDRKDDQGLREMLRSRKASAPEKELEESGAQSALPLPRQSGFAGGRP
jgi:hypothetical protein